MENIINLEQLDYRDQLIKDYIDEHMQPAPVVGAAVNCELYVYTNKEAEEASDKQRLYIRCGKGQLLETDSLQFARNKVSNCVWRDSETDEKQRRKKKGRGWIIPRYVNQVPLTMIYDDVFSSASDKFDYWQIKPLNPEGEVWEWEDLINIFLGYRNEHGEWSVEYDWEEDPETGEQVPSNPRPEGSWSGTYYNTYANFINRWCGLSVVRDNVNITPYMLWRIEGGWRWDNPGNGYFTSLYLADGCNRKDWMNAEADQEDLTGGWDGDMCTYIIVIK